MSDPHAHAAPARGQTPAQPSQPVRPPETLSPDALRSCGREVLGWIAAYWERLQRDPSSLPVLARSKPGEVLAQLPPHPPELGEASGDRAEEALRAVLADMDRSILPNLTHWQHPHFYAYFGANISTPAVLGELLSAGLGVQGMLWATSPAATELEMRVMDWMAELIGLPQSFTHASGQGGGVIQGTASEAVLAAIVAARHRARTVWREGRSHEATGATPHFTLYASTQTHSSVTKAAMIAGLADHPEDFTHVRLVGVDRACAMRADLLEAAIREDLARGRVPMFVCASVGTTATTAVDDVRAIGGTIASTGATTAWLHVDAAHAGAMCVCPEHRGLLAGVERADSVCFNPHKWLLTNFDCDCFWVRERRWLVGAMSITPDYLRTAQSDAGLVHDFRDWHVPLGRRFRALKLWMTIRWFGAEGLRAYVREHVRLAMELERWAREDPRFEVATPRSMNLVGLRLRGDPSRDAAKARREGDERTRRLGEALNASGKAFATLTTIPAFELGEDGVDREVGKQRVLRIVIAASLTREEHVRELWGLLQHLATEARA
jgi:aromatic-L-amino-acid decarboxylase